MSAFWKLREQTLIVLKLFSKAQFLKELVKSFEKSGKETGPFKVVKVKKPRKKIKPEDKKPTT